VDKSGDDEIIDFNSGLVKKLRGELTDSRQILDDIVKGSRIYWQRVQAVHDAVLLMMEAEDLKHAITLLNDEVARLLGMDTIQFFLQRDAGEVVSHAAMLLKPIPPIATSMMDQKAFVLREAESAMLLFPSNSSPIESAAGVPIAVEGLKGLLALGCRAESNFGSGQALEPYIFFAHVIERMAPKWLTAKS
jgi:uncharacterized protein YigA (DUF484 family)